MPENQNQDAGVVVRLDVPLDHHPAAVTGESSGAQIGRRALEGIYSCVGRVNDTALRVSDKARLAQAAQPVCEGAVKSAGAAIDRLRARIDGLDSEVAQILKAPVEPHQAGQIRDYWRGQTGAKGLGGIRKAIEEGDGVTVSAVLNAPAYLSGLTPENQALLRTMAAEVFAPQQTLERTESAQALQRVEKAVGWFVDTMTEKLRTWRDEDARIIEEGLKDG